VRSACDSERPTTVTHGQSWSLSSGRPESIQSAFPLVRALDTNPKLVVRGRVELPASAFQADARLLSHQADGHTTVLPYLRKLRKVKATMTVERHPPGSCQPYERQIAGRRAAADPAGERKTMAGTATAPPAGRAAGRGAARRRHPVVPAAPGRRGQGGQDGAGLHRRGALVRRRLPAGQAGKTSWEQVDARDIQQWTAQLLDRAAPNGT
jgi:hypothetical protein